MSKPIPTGVVYPVAEKRKEQRRLRGDHLCLCGCGETPPKATHTRVKRGHQKGVPVFFAIGHHLEKRASDRLYNRSAEMLRLRSERGDSLCLCGCGVTPPPAKKTSKRSGTTKGAPVFFIRGHHHFLGDMRNYVSMPEYRSYNAAKARCTRLNHRQYHRYGGRGIRFRFQSFQQFMDTLGPRPTIHHTVDRINNDGHYEPGNVRWATRTEQNRNSTAAKICASGADEIRMLILAGFKPGLIAKNYGLSVDSIRRIRIGESWA